MQLELDWVFFLKDLSVDWWAGHIVHICLTLFDFSPLCLFPSCVCLVCLNAAEAGLSLLFFTVCLPLLCVSVEGRRGGGGERGEIWELEMCHQMTQSLGSTLFGQICFGFSMNFIISWEKKPFTKSKKISHARCSDWV